MLIVFDYKKNWKKLAYWEIPTDFTPSTKFTVIIPVRNEAEYISDCLNSILDQNYPKSLFRIIVVDDHSEDETVSIANSFNSKRISVLSLSQFELANGFNSYKKFGIEKAIEKSEGDLLIHTDGDCIVQKNWLAYFASHYQENKKSFIGAPVNFHSGKNGIQNFQELDMMGMMLITGAGVQKKKGHICNGANLAYTKSLFNAVGGFEGIDDQASGDDVLLMQKIAQHDLKEIAYIKNPEATVYTQPAKTWSKFKSQRIRWASKSKSYTDSSVQLSLVAVFIFHLLIVISLLGSIYFGPIMILVSVLMLLIKAFADFSLLNSASTFFRNKEAMLQFIPSFFIHIYYIVYIGILSNVRSNYKWKGREVK